MTELEGQLKRGEITLDSLLKPGKYLNEATPESLEIKIMPSGFKSFDDYLMLKQNEGELIVIAGEPSMGKSALMTQIAFNVSTHSPVHILSLEYSYESIVRRRIAA